MNLYVMPIGVEGAKASLGSLDFLGTDEAEVQMSLSVEGMGVAPKAAQRVSGGGSLRVEEGVTARLPDLGKLRDLLASEPVVSNRRV